MPTKCSVSGCESYYSKGVPFFDIPSPLKYKFSTEKAELSTKRRKLWLDAMGVVKDSSEMLRICDKHFVTGKPATLDDTKDVDWIPTLHMKSASSDPKKHRKGSEEDVKKYKKDKYKSSHSSKDKKSTPRSNKSKEKYNISEEKVKMKGSRRSSPKVDDKKLSNNKVLLDGNIQCPSFKGTNGSGLTIAQKHGNFTSDDVTVTETALNNTVLRIHLINEDLQDLKRKYKLSRINSPKRKKQNEQATSSFGRHIKRKSNFFEDSYILTPLKRSSNPKSIENAKPSGSIIEKSKRQMKNPEEKEYQGRSELKNKFHMKELESSSRTLNRTIKKNYRDKIKIKLFPKVSPSVSRTIKNAKTDESAKPHREILFVKNYKTEPQLCGSDKTYFLKFTPSRYPEDGTLGYPFQKLVADVKHMKLPGPSWKIKVIIKQGKIGAVTFTNKLTPERYVSFSANSNRYTIFIDDRPALLLGSPEQIQNSEDLEILLDIIENFDPKNPMIFYK